MSKALSFYGEIQRISAEVIALPDLSPEQKAREIALRVITLLSKSIVYIPALSRILNPGRNKEIVEQAESGVGIESLATKYKLTKGHIRRIIRSNNDSCA